MNLPFPIRGASLNAFRYRRQRRRKLIYGWTSVEAELKKWYTYKNKQCDVSSKEGPLYAADQ